jgi:hypothetical protein
MLSYILLIGFLAVPTGTPKIGTNTRMATIVNVFCPASVHFSER